jgi:hypothetical protein
MIAREYTVRALRRPRDAPPTLEPHAREALDLRYSATQGGFDDTALVEFIRDKEMIAFREHGLRPAKASQRVAAPPCP